MNYYSIKKLIINFNSWKTQAVGWSNSDIRTFNEAFGLWTY